MSNPIVLWAVLLVGGVSAGGMLWSQADRIATLEARQAPAPVESDDNLAEVQALTERVAALEAANDEREIVRERPARRADGERHVDREPAPEQIDEVAAAVAPAAKRAVVAALTNDDPKVRRHLRKMIETSRDAERETRRARRSERREERIRQVVSDLTDNADLSETQREAVETQLMAEKQAITSLFRAAREDGSWREAHRDAEAVKGSTDAQLKETLGAEQYEQYKKLREEDGWGRH